MTSEKSRFRGCLLAGAVGDALGAPIEFMSRAQITSKFGAQGLRDFVSAYGRVGAITDDTQMTLFTAEGVLRAQVRATGRGICHRPSVISHAYRRWLLTQGVAPADGQKPPTDGWLFSLPALHSRRAPGRTCLQALQNTPVGEPAANDSKGCGGVMRAAPIGLFGWHFRARGGAAQAFELAVDAAALTHGHPSGYLTAGVLSAVICELADGVSLDLAVEQAIALLSVRPAHEESLAAIEAARELAARDPSADIEQLGQGWVAEEALAMGLFAALTAPNLSEGLLRAVNHSGNSDSTGAIAGNLLGAMLGEEAIPASWLDSLELRDEIAIVAEDLFACSDWDFDSMAPEAQRPRDIWQRYPGH